MSSTLVALQAERDMLLRSATEKDAELSSLRQQTQQQQSSLDLEKDRLSRELEALRAQLQQQVPAGRRRVTPHLHHIGYLSLWNVSFFLARHQR